MVRVAGIPLFRPYIGEPTRFGEPVILRTGRTDFLPFRQNYTIDSVGLPAHLHASRATRGIHRETAPDEKPPARTGGRRD
jgi:hypothetical protein